MPLLTGPLPEHIRSIHIMGIGGTAMAAMAGMLKDAGFLVTGSDTGVYPPMSDYLEGLGIPVMIGYRAENLAHRPDLVVVGNVIQAVFPEAAALLASDLLYCSFPQLLGAWLLERRRSIVVAGTHGKTTSTALAAWLLEAAGRSPGFLIGGRAKDFDRTARTGAAPFFVIEGDEYDTAFFDKGPKFLHYRPDTAIITSVEFDHADIYRDLAHVQESFVKLVGIVPASGCIVARWDHDNVAAVCRGAAAPIRRYGRGQEWDGRIEGVDTDRGVQRFAVLRDGRLYGRYEGVLCGEHNLYNSVAVVAALDAEGIRSDEMEAGFRTFTGVRRRQDVIGEPRGITVIDDFAHHPTAVEETIGALRLRFGQRRLWVIFEPRSNTSRRKVFQDRYAEVFGGADIVILPTPPDQARLAESDRFDSALLVQRLRARGIEAFHLPTVEEIVAVVAANALPHDVVAVFSNGGFNSIHTKLLAALA